MSLAGLPSLFLLPPLNCMVAACAGAVWRHRRAGRVLLVAGLAALVLLSIPLVAGSLLATLQTGLPTRPDLADPPGAVVILAGNDAEVQTADGPGYEVGWLTLERERAGARLARYTGLPILVSGGVIRPGAPTLASLMAASLHEDFALPVTWQEQHSIDTWENAADSARILRQAGIGTVYVVTHAWHMRRALMAFRAAGVHAVAAPVSPAAWPRLRWASLVPRVSAWEDSYFAAHEWVGCAWYWLRG